MTQARRHAASALWALLALAAAPPAGADGDILYYEDQGQVVFTNIASRREARPVPSLATVSLALPADLPATPFDSYIREVAREADLPPSLIKAVALVESGFNPQAVSPKGARGLMQLMPGTAAQYGVRDPHDPLQNLRAGALHLRDLYDEFDGNQTLALAAYNAGAGAVRRSGGVVPDYAETRAYVRRVQNHLGERPPPVGSRAAAASAIVVEEEADGTVRLSN